MIYISLIYVIALHIGLFRHRRLLDPVSVFFLAFLYYSYFAPIVMLNFEQFSVDFAGAASWVSQETINRSAILYAIGYSGFAIGYHFVSGNAATAGYVIRNLSVAEALSDTYARILLAVIFLTIVILSTVFSDELLVSTSSYEGKISENYGNSSYAFVVNSALTILSLITNYIILNTKRFVIISVAFVFLFFILAILTYSKAPLIYAALCGFCVLHRFDRIPFGMLMLGLIGGAILTTVFFLPMFSIYRATNVLTLQPINAESIGIMMGEASSPFTIVHLALNGYVSTSDHPLWQSFVLWIPRGIWPDRPLDLAESFAQQVISGWQAGFGLGFSPFAEAYARAGMAGSAIFMALVGATMAGMNRLFAYLVPTVMRVPAMLTIGGLVSVLVLRGVFSGLITQGIQNWVPVIAVSFIASEIDRRLRESRIAGREMIPHFVSGN